MSEKLERQILEAVEALRLAPTRLRLAAVKGIAESLIAYLKTVPGVRRTAAAGSHRRRRETVGDLDILATADPGSPVMQRFIGYSEVREVAASGSSGSTVMLKSGLQVDLRVVADDSYGAALAYFTGSKAHNIAIRRLSGAQPEDQRVRRLPRRRADRRRH